VVAGQRPAGEGLPQSPPSSFGNPAADHLADFEHTLTLDNAYSL
jgi:hypothetical protein